MAGNCYHHHHQCCCCCCSFSHCPCNPISPTPISITTDSALLTIATYLATSLQHHRQPPPPPPSQADSVHLQPLLQRLSALESTLHHLSLTQLSQPPPHRPTQAKQHHPRARTQTRSQSLRDHAARTIQTRFRLFLIRQSCKLRHLKLIAFAQTFLTNLRARLADRAQLLLLHQKPAARRLLAERAADLLAKVDSIRSADSMIREAKRSVSRDMVGVLEVLDGSSRRSGGSEKWVAVGSTNSSPEKVGSYSRGSIKSQKPFYRCTGEDSSVRRTGPFGLMNDDGRSSPDVGGRDGSECDSFEDDKAPSSEKVVEILNTGDSGSSSGEKSQEEGEDGFPGFHCGDVSLGLSAPVPLQMEPRRIDLEKELKQKNGVRFDLQESVG